MVVGDGVAGIGLCRIGVGNRDGSGGEDLRGQDQNDHRRSKAAVAPVERGSGVRARSPPRAIRPLRATGDRNPEVRQTLAAQSEVVVVFSLPRMTTRGHASVSRQQEIVDVRVNTGGVAQEGVGGLLDAIHGVDRAPVITIPAIEAGLPPPVDVCPGARWGEPLICTDAGRLV